jgi:hypothetical protein
MIPDSRFARSLAALLFMAAASALPERPRAETLPTGSVEVLSQLGGRTDYSACAVYMHGDGRRYVLLGSLYGTVVVNATDASAPREVAFLPSLHAKARDIVVYRSWGYASSPALGSGIQIIRLADPEHPVVAATFDRFFDACAALVLDEARALLFVVNATFQGGSRGIFVLSIADPEAPVVVGQYEGASRYGQQLQGAALHGNRLFASTGDGGGVVVVDVSNPAAPVEVGSWGYAGSYHARDVAISRRGDYLYVTDAAQAQALRVFQLGDPGKQTPRLVHEHSLKAPLFPFATTVAGDVAYAAALSGGVRLLDLADPGRPAEFARFDPYDGPDGGMHGICDVALVGPGLFAASSVEDGLFLCRVRSEYGTVRVVVLEEGGIPIPGAAVRWRGETIRTQTDGSARFAAAPGPAAFAIDAFGFEPAAASVDVTRGQHIVFRIRLRTLPAADVRGVVRAEPGGAPVARARLRIVEPGIEIVADEEGAYTIPELPAGRHTLRCDADGLVAEERAITVEGGGARDLDWTLRTAPVHHPLEGLVPDWITDAQGDDAPIGQWILTSPTLVLRHEGVALSPYGDHTDDGVACFQTAAPGLSFEPTVTVQQGRTTLTSPWLPLGSMADPRVGYWTWYGVGVPDEPESLIVSLSSDGVDFVPVATLRASDPAWRYREIRVRDWFDAAAEVRIRFTVADRGTPSLVSAAVDDVVLFDGALRASPPPEPAAAPVAGPGMRLEAPYPSPTRGAALVLVRLPAPARVRADLYDVKGRLVAALHDGPAAAGTFAVHWNGADRNGEPAASGVYFVKVRAPGFEESARVVKVK